MNAISEDVVTILYMLKNLEDLEDHFSPLLIRANIRIISDILLLHYSSLYMSNCIGVALLAVNGICLFGQLNGIWGSKHPRPPKISETIKGMTVMLVSIGRHKINKNF